jgi:hypothetical protein
MSGHRNRKRRLTSTVGLRPLKLLAGTRPYTSDCSGTKLTVQRRCVGYPHSDVSAADVALQLFNRELLVFNHGLHEITDRDHTHHLDALHDWQMADALIRH